MPPISRRDIIKTALAGGGLVLAGGLLSGRWMRPVAALSKLPSHALASAACSPDDYHLYADIYYYHGSPQAEGAGTPLLSLLFLVPLDWTSQDISWRIDSVPTLDNDCSFLDTPPLSGTDMVHGYPGEASFPVFYMPGIVGPRLTIPIPTKISFTIHLSRQGGDPCIMTYTDYPVNFSPW